MKIRWKMNSLKKRFPSLSSLGVSEHELLLGIKTIFIDIHKNVKHFCPSIERSRQKSDLIEFSIFTEKTKTMKNFSGSLLIFQLPRERFIFSIPIGRAREADDDEEEDVGKSVFICCNNCSPFVLIHVDSEMNLLHSQWHARDRWLVGVRVLTTVVSEWSQQLNKQREASPTASTCRD